MTVIPAMVLRDLVMESARLTADHAEKMVADGYVTINGAHITTPELIVPLAQDQPPEIKIKGAKINLVYS